MLATIVLNAIVLFLLSFPVMHHNVLLRIIDDLFILFFLIEALVKIYEYSWKGYIRSNWNKFDLFIVLVSLPSLAITFFGASSGLSFILLFRLLRLVRLIQFMKFVPNLKHLMLGLVRAFKASIFVLIALMGYNFMLSIFTCQLYGGIAPDYFGDPLRASYTIFQLFTVEGWNEIPQNIIDNAPKNQAVNYWQAGLLRFYFVFLVLTGGIFGMSLANAVFVDEMTMDNNAIVEDKINQLEHKIDQLLQMIEQQKK